MPIGAIAPFGIEIICEVVYFWQEERISKRGSISRAMSFDGIKVRLRRGIMIMFLGKRKRIISLWV